ncbi:unnamed protein product, partial [Adineta ricciae]
DGTFFTSANYTVDNSPSSIISYDLNNDTYVDLAVTNYVENTVNIYLGNGDGTFEEIKSLSTGVDPTFILAGDLDGDERLDLVITDALANTISILLNTCKI